MGVQQHSSQDYTSGYLKMWKCCLLMVNGINDTGRITASGPAPSSPWPTQNKQNSMFVGSSSHDALSRPSENFPSRFCVYILWFLVFGFHGISVVTNTCLHVYTWSLHFFCGSFSSVLTCRVSFCFILSFLFYCF